jgi:opacity protein-like surface antigen
MKKFLIAAAGLSALAAAAPAAAQYHPAYGYGQPQGYGYGYGQPQGYGYGYNNRDQHGLIRSYIVRADRLRMRVERLDSRDRISEREARRLRDDAAELQRRVRDYARNGLSFNERRDLDYRLARLEQRVRMDVRDGRERYAERDWDRDGRRDDRDGWVDRNRNGIDDRYERRWDRDDD